jgi:hypothetical protein
MTQNINHNSGIEQTKEYLKTKTAEALKQKHKKRHQEDNFEIFHPTHLSCH